MAQNTIYNSIGSGFYLICQWLMTVLVIRLGSVEKGGILTLVMTVTNVFIPLSNIGRPYQVTDYEGKYQTGEYVGTRFFSCAVSLLLCMLYCLLYPEYSHNEILFIMAFMFFRTVEAFSDEYQAIQQISGRMDIICVSFIIRGILSLLSFSLGLLFTQSLLFAFIAMTVSTGAVVLLFDVRICKKLQSYHLILNIKKSIQLIIDSLPVLINALMISLCITIPKTALNKTWGNYTMGIYGSIAAPTMIIPTVAMWLFLPFLPRFAELYHEKRKKEFNRLNQRIFLSICLVSALILFAAFLLGKWGLNLIFGEEIASYSFLLVPTLLTMVFVANEYFFSHVLTAIRQLKYVVISNAIAFITSLITSKAFVLRFEAMGVNYSIYISVGICIIIQSIALLFCSRKWFKR